MQVYVQACAGLRLATVHLTKASHVVQSRVYVGEVGTGN